MYFLCFHCSKHPNSQKEIAVIFFTFPENNSVAFSSEYQKAFRIHVTNYVRCFKYHTWQLGFAMVYLCQPWRVVHYLFKWIKNFKTIIPNIIC